MLRNLFLSFFFFVCVCVFIYCVCLLFALSPLTPGSPGPGKWGPPLGTLQRGDCIGSLRTGVTLNPHGLAGDERITTDPGGMEQIPMGPGGMERVAVDPSTPGSSVTGPKTPKLLPAEPPSPVPRGAHAELKVSGKQTVKLKNKTPQYPKSCLFLLLPLDLLSFVISWFPFIFFFKSVFIKC